MAEVLLSSTDKPEVSLLGKPREKAGPVTKQKALSPKLLSDNLLASLGVFLSCHDSPFSLELWASASVYDTPFDLPGPQFLLAVPRVC